MAAPADQVAAATHTSGESHGNTLGASKAHEVKRFRAELIHKVAETDNTRLLQIGDRVRLRNAWF